jgi:hypothetical protein
MKKNLGSFDIGARFILGCGLLLFCFNGLGPWGLLGLGPLFTSFIGICPLYWILRIDTAAWEARWEARHPHPPYDPPHNS